MKHLVGKDVTKTTKFMEEDVTIRKLTAAQLIEVQKLLAAQAKALSGNKKPKEDDAEKTALDLARKVVRLGCTDAGDLTDDDFYHFPTDELNNLVEAILSFSGLGEMDQAGN